MRYLLRLFVFLGVLGVSGLLLGPVISGQVYEETLRINEFQARNPQSSWDYRGVVNASGGLICDFGSQGIWGYDGTWHKINNQNPDWILGWRQGLETHVVVDFGTGGLWYWDYNGAWPGIWNKISVMDSAWGYVVDQRGNGYQDIHIYFGAGSGIWAWFGGWYQMTANTCSSVFVGSLWTPDLEEGYFDFGTEGFWCGYWDWYFENFFWHKLSGSNPGDDNLAAHILGSHAQELVVDFDNQGLWIYDGLNWHKVNDGAVLDVRAPGHTDVSYDRNEGFVASFSGVAGLWSWKVGTGYPGTWTKIADKTPTWDEAFCEFLDIDKEDAEWFHYPIWDELVVDFGTDGLWLRWGTWQKISNNSPEFMLNIGRFLGAWGENLLCDFGAQGLWIYYYDYGHKWVKISSSSPDPN